MLRNSHQDYPEKLIKNLSFYNFHLNRLPSPFNLWNLYFKTFLVIRCSNNFELKVIKKKQNSFKITESNYLYFTNKRHGFGRILFLII